MGAATRSSPRSAVVRTAVAGLVLLLLLAVASVATSTVDASSRALEEALDASFFLAAYAVFVAATSIGATALAEKEDEVLGASCLFVGADNSSALLRASSGRFHGSASPSETRCHYFSTRAPAGASLTDPGVSRLEVRHEHLPARGRGGRGDRGAAEALAVADNATRSSGDDDGSEGAAGPARRLGRDSGGSEDPRADGGAEDRGDARESGEAGPARRRTVLSRLAVPSAVRVLERVPRGGVRALQMVAYDDPLRDLVLKLGGDALVKMAGGDVGPPWLRSAMRAVVQHDRWIRRRIKWTRLAQRIRNARWIRNIKWIQKLSPFRIIRWDLRWMMFVRTNPLLLNVMRTTQWIPILRWMGAVRWALMVHHVATA